MVFMKKIKNFGLLLISFISSIVLIYLIQTLNNTDFKNPDLGNENQYVFDEKFLCEEFDKINNCLNFLKSSEFNKKIVWLGNSQLMVINNPDKGEFTASTLAFNRWGKKDITIITFAMPNASLKEHYILFEYFVNKVKIDIFIISIVFDDTRENRIRSQLIEAVKDKNVNKQLIRSQIGKSIINSSYLSENKEKKVSLQTKAEGWINKNIQMCCKWISIRESTQSLISIHLYKFRNYVFNIKPTTKRKMVLGYYEQNLKSLERLLKRSNELQIEVLLYISPLRQDISIPYDLNEYNRFKNNIEELALNYEAHYTNLENIVDGSLWGLKRSTTLKNVDEIDFMHFKYEGHEILENKISEKLKEIIE